jgi:hypothetical protein
MYVPESRCEKVQEGLFTAEIAGTAENKLFHV